MLAHWFAPRRRPALPPLPPGHMAQRPYDTHVLNLGPASIGYFTPRPYRERDAVIVVDAANPHFGKRGTVIAISGTVKPLVVEFEDRLTVAYFDADQVELDPSAPIEDTREMDAFVDLGVYALADTAELELAYADDVPLMGGTR